MASEFCSHVKSRTHYGEINLDLNPIELSIVVTGADPRAKIRKIIASLDEYRAQADALRKVKGAPLEALAAVDGQISDLEGQLLAQDGGRKGSDKVAFSEAKLLSDIGYVEANEPDTDEFREAAKSLIKYMSDYGMNTVYSTIKKSKLRSEDALVNALKRIANASLPARPEVDGDPSEDARSMIKELTRLNVSASSGTEVAPTPATGTTSAGEDAMSGISTRGPATLDPTGTLSEQTGYGPFDRGDESGRHGLTPGIFGLASIYKDIPLKKDAFEHEKGSNAISERITSIKNSLIV